MIGAIAGDIIGSVYEWQNIKTKQFDLFRPDCFFTDDTVLTVALAESILTQTDYASLMKDYYRRYPGAGYGGLFHQWAQAHDSEPYNSWGNGAAMRISAVGFAFNTLDEVLLRDSCQPIARREPYKIRALDHHENVPCVPSDVPRNCFQPEL